MAIAYESETVDKASTSRSTLTLTKPSGTVSGDLLVASISFGSNSSTPGKPSGWTTVDAYDTGAFSDWYGTYYLFAGGSEPSNYSWTQSSSGTMRGVIQRFSGVDSYGGVGTISAASKNVMDYGSVTPDEDGCLLWLSGHGFHGSTIPSPPSGYTNGQDGGAVTGPELQVASKVQGTAAATGTVTSTGWTSHASVPQRGHQLWFRPDTGGGGGPSMPPFFQNRYRHLLVR